VAGALELADHSREPGCVGEGAVDQDDGEARHGVLLGVGQVTPPTLRHRTRARRPGGAPPGLLTRARHRLAASATPRRPHNKPGGLTRDHILDNVTLYWLTGTGASAARSYWENTQAAAAAAASGQARPEVKLPVGFTTFPGEIFRAPRSWAEKSYPSLQHFNIGNDRMPKEVYHAYGYVKKAAGRQHPRRSAACLEGRADRAGLR
jgi:hypothetical protein